MEFSPFKLDIYFFTTLFVFNGCYRVNLTETFTLINKVYLTQYKEKDICVMMTFFLRNYF